MYIAFSFQKSFVCVRIVAPMEKNHPEELEYLQKYMCIYIFFLEAGLLDESSMELFMKTAYLSSQCRAHGKYFRRWPQFPFLLLTVDCTFYISK